jgi:hypothetical protein
VVALLFPQIFPASFRSAEGTVGVYFEAATVIVTLVLLGQMLEQRALDCGWSSGRSFTGPSYSREALLALLEFKIRTAGKTHDALDSQSEIIALRAVIEGRSIDQVKIVLRRTYLKSNDNGIDGTISHT